MDNYLYNVLKIYFNTVENIGYIKYSEVYKVLYILILEYLINNDLKECITEEDIQEIRNSYNCLFGSSCMFKYPSNCK